MSKTLADKVRLSPKEFEIDENNVTKTGVVSLRLTGVDDEPLLDEVDRPLPVDYMHVIPNTTGSEIEAGIFKSRKK